MQFPLSWFPSFHSGQIWNFLLRHRHHHRPPPPPPPAPAPDTPTTEYRPGRPASVTCAKTAETAVKAGAARAASVGKVCKFSSYSRSSIDVISRESNDAVGSQTSDGAVKEIGTTLIFSFEFSDSAKNGWVMNWSARAFSPWHEFYI